MQVLPLLMHGHSGVSGEGGAGVTDHVGWGGRQEGDIARGRDVHPEDTLRRHRKYCVIFMPVKGISIS